MIALFYNVELIEQEVLSLTESSLAKTGNDSATTQQRASDILDSSKFDLKLDKSNILMLGPTGSGEFNVFVAYWQYVALMVVLWCPALSSSSSSASVAALR